jgi:hypothetical protein
MKEKLIELIVQSGHVSGFVRGLADHLIANGIRLEENQATSDEIKQYVPDTNVGKWIPVSERLPKKEDAKIMDGYLPAIERGKKPNICKWTEVAKHPEYFTHWMLLPEPPKEE